jgi:hypothetical protein
VTDPNRLRYPSAWALSSVPNPLRINRPQRNVGKHNDRVAGGLALEVRLEPLDLLRAELTKAFERRDIGQADEVDVLMVEAVPAAPCRLLTVTLQVHLAVVKGCIVLARDKENLLRFGAFQHSIEGIEFGRFGYGSNRLYG